MLHNSKFGNLSRRRQWGHRWKTRISSDSWTRPKQHLSMKRKRKLSHWNCDFEKFEIFTGRPIDAGMHTCFCCDLCNSSIWALSLSNNTGAYRITELVKNIQDAVHVNLYKPLVLLTVNSVSAPHTFRSGCGNISVRPHKRSATDSSGSCATKKKWKTNLTLVEWEWIGAWIVERPILISSPKSCLQLFKFHFRKIYLWNMRTGNEHVFLLLDILRRNLLLLYYICAQHINYIDNSGQATKLLNDYNILESNFRCSSLSYSIKNSFSHTLFGYELIWW